MSEAPLPLFISDDDLATLIGLHKSPSQIRWLTERGWKFAIGASGRPRVARDEFNRMMVGNNAAGKGGRKRPNFEALRA